MQNRTCSHRRRSKRWIDKIGGIGNGDTGYVFGLLDMHDDAFVTLTGHPEKKW
ncbi:MAG: hypothetical protein OIN86_03030 [Candidatus Methanoperedens sp.]|nr:hypothetical protein [Candidatus Methanoperedens sp.]CAG0980390.1 hypothetical protein METP1_01739 [Methanosarcinales archaeon]